MRTLIPYTERHPLTEAGAPPNAEWRDVSADDHAYWRVLCEFWERGESFLVVEHDVICRPAIIDAVTSCPEPWCCYGYDDICCPGCNEAWANTLGCTRFSAELIAACPEALSSIPEAQRDWHNLCDSIAGDKIEGVPAPLGPKSVRAAGFTHHWHFPAVYHHHMGRGRPFGPENRVTANA